MKKHLFLLKFFKTFLFYIIFTGYYFVTAENNVYKLSNQFKKSTSPSVSAVLVQCPKQQTIPECNKKILVNMRVSADGDIAQNEKYLILDEVFDRMKQSKAKLMSPYLIEVSRGEPILMYPLQFVKNVKFSPCEKNNKENDIQEKMSQESNSTYGPSMSCEKSAGLPKKRIQITVGLHAQSNKKQNSDSNEKTNNLDKNLSMKKNIRNSNQNSYKPKKKNQNLVGKHKINNEYQNNPNNVKFYQKQEENLQKINKKPANDQSNFIQKIVPLIVLKADQNNEKMSKNKDEILSSHKGQSNPYFNYNFQNNPLYRYKPNEQNYMPEMNNVPPQRDRMFEIKNNFIPQKQLTEISNVDYEKAFKNPNEKYPEQIKLAQAQIVQRLNDMIVPQTSTQELSNNDISYILEKYPGIMVGIKNAKTNNKNLNNEIKMYDEKINDQVSEYRDQSQYSQVQNKNGQAEPNVEYFSYYPNTNPYNNKNAYPLLKSPLEKEVPNVFPGIQGNIESPQELSRNYLVDPTEKKTSAITNNGKQFKANNNILESHYNQFENENFENLKSFNDNQIEEMSVDEDFDEREIAPHFRRSQSSTRLDFNNPKEDIDEPNQENTFDENPQIQTEKLQIQPRCSGDFCFSNNQVDILRNYIQSKLLGVEKNVPQHQDQNKYHNSLYYPDVTFEEAARADDSRIAEESSNNMGPYIKLLKDPYLHLNDKMQLINMMDPRDIKLEKLLKNLDTESSYPYLSYMVEPNLFGFQNYSSNCGKLLNKRSSSKDNFYSKTLKKKRYDRQNKIYDVNSKYFIDSQNNHEREFDDKEEFFPESNDENFNDETNRKYRSISEIWYAVYNMSVPSQFLTSQIRIFRKKEGLLWKIAPPIVLTTLSGSYANENLSISFLFHARTYDFNKPLTLKNYQLLVSIDESLKMQNILAIDPEEVHLGDFNTENEEIQKAICNTDYQEYKRQQYYKRNINGILSLSEFGIFPTTMKTLEKCKGSRNSLCLNLIDEEAPEYLVKIQLPFKDNAVVYNEHHKVLTASIISDATANEAVEINILVINQALIAHEYVIGIANCPVTHGFKHSVNKTLLPHRGEYINFFLPLKDRAHKKQHYCEVQTINKFHKIVSRRQIIIKPGVRCLCIWHCSCHCIDKPIADGEETTCSTLKIFQEEDAGFLQFKIQRSNKKILIIKVLFIFIAILLILGFLKAFLGCFYPVIDQWKYDKLQPMNKYFYASRFQRFFINILFFTAFPFVMLCACFMPKDEDLSNTTGKIDFKITQHRLESDEYDTDNYYTKTEEDESYYRKTTGSSSSEKHSQFKIDGSQAMMHEIMNVKYNEEEDDKDTNFVLNALAESRETLRLMDEHYSEELDMNNPEHNEATQLVKSLLSAKLVYRIFDKPIGNVKLRENVMYSIRGYFVPSIGPGYQFITHIPLRQHWLISDDTNSLLPIIPPIVLISKEFAYNYENKMDVLKMGDLYVNPLDTTPCINVLVQSYSMYKKKDDPNVDT